jgi:hypothetical protein
VSTRRIFVYSALLVLLITSPALAGQYQRTKDGRTLVWNEDHKPGDLVSWSGKRDADGYAAGYGTLTWYTPEDMRETGSNVPRKGYRVSSRVSGTMDQGKLASAGATAQAAIEPEKPKKRRWLNIFKPRSKPTPAQIEATPKPRPKSRSTHIEATPEESEPTPTPKEAASPKPTTPSPTPANDSLDSLMHAPSSLKLSSPAASPSPGSPSQAATPDVSLQPAQPTSPSPIPSP